MNESRYIAQQVKKTNLLNKGILAHPALIYSVQLPPPPPPPKDPRPPMPPLDPPDPPEPPPPDGLEFKPCMLLIFNKK